MLRELGIPGSATDDALYVALVRGTASDEDDLAAELGVSTDTVHASAIRLRDLGLIVPTNDDSPSRRWIAAAPDLAVSPVLTRSRERLRRAEEAMLDLVDMYRRHKAPDSPSELVELIEGRAAQGQRLLDLQAGARRTISGFQTGHNTVTPVSETITVDEPPGEDGEARVGAALRQVHQRIVVDREFLSEPAAVKVVEERLRHGQEVRVVDEPLIKLLIADDEIGMMQVSPSTAVLLRSPLIALGVELFETTWRHARPYQGDDAQVSAEDRHLLQLMLAGLTDAAAAHELGTSPRTVQRRLRALMNRADVSTRVQLGWYALRNDWI